LLSRGIHLTVALLAKYSEHYTTVDYSMILKIYTLLSIRYRPYSVAIQTKMWTNGNNTEVK